MPRMAIATEITAEVAEYAHGRVPRAIRERQILALILHVEFLVGGCFGLTCDVLFDSDRDISLAYFLRLALRMFRSPALRNL